MNFFLLNNANEIEITGKVYPQISSYENWCKDNYNYLTSELGPDKLPDKDIILDYLNLDDKAILTDFLSVYNPIWGFILSDKVKKVFKEIILPEHKYSKVIIQQNKIKKNNYCWLQMVSKNSDKIMFSKSSFRLMKGLLPVTVDIRTFASVNEIFQFEKDNFRIKVKPNEIFIDYSKIQQDIFQLRVVNFDWIITDTVKKLIFKNGITGCEIKKIDWLKAI